MPKYRLTRERTQDMVLEIEAETPLEAVQKAYRVDRNKWMELGSAGLAPIDAVSEGLGGRCWEPVWDEDSDSLSLVEVDDG